MHAPLIKLGRNVCCWLLYEGHKLFLFPAETSHLFLDIDSSMWGNVWEFAKSQWWIWIEKTAFCCEGSMTDSRWSCGAVATKALACSYSRIYDALSKLMNDPDQNADTCAEARSLISNMKRIECTFMTLLCTAPTSLSLQTTSIELGCAVKLL